MHGFFDKVACVAVGRARSAKAREGASDIHLERFALGVFFMLPNLSCGAGGRPVLRLPNMPLITYAAVEGVQVRQPAKS